jgi:hypothetical protein
MQKRKLIEADIYQVRKVARGNGSTIVIPAGYLIAGSRFELLIYGL